MRVFEVERHFVDKDSKSAPTARILSQITGNDALRTGLRTAFDIVGANMTSGRAPPQRAAPVGLRWLRGAAAWARGARGARGAWMSLYE